MARAASGKAHAHTEKETAEPAPVEQAVEVTPEAPHEASSPAAVEVVDEEPGELSTEEPTSLEQTPKSVLDDDMGDFPQPSQDPEVLVESDERAEG